MPPFHIVQIERFLRGHQPAIAGFLEQAYSAAGGHYAAMTPARRREQAEVDSEEYIAGLLVGGVDRAVVQQAAHGAVAAGIAVEDILRMSAALERLMVPFVERELAAQPVIAAELLRRVHNIAASFRANMAAVQLDTVLRRMQPPPAEF